MSYFKNNHLLKTSALLSKEIGEKVKIYLDTNFWICLQQEARQSVGDKRKLLDCLILLVETGKYVVPISEVTFLEIMKQKDFQTLSETAAIVDFLSKGVSLLPQNEIIQLEFLRYQNQQPDEKFHFIYNNWTLLPFVSMSAAIRRGEAGTEHKSFLELLGSSKFTSLLSINGNQPAVPFHYKDDVDKLNESKLEYAHQNKTYDQMFLSEVAGLLEALKEKLNEATEIMRYAIYGNQIQLEERNHPPYHMLLYEGFKTKKINSELPFFKIFSELNAYARWNKTRKYKDGNDTMDFMHACAALPYFDYFFTEKELKSNIKATKLDMLYSTTVESNYDAVVAILRNLPLI